MEASDESRSSTPAGTYAGRRRSISIIDAGELSDHTPKPFLGSGRPTDPFPPPPPLLYSLHAEAGGTTGATTTPSPAKALVQAPVTSPRTNTRPDETALTPGCSSTINSGSPLVHAGAGPHLLSPASERTSLFRTPSYRAASASVQGNNVNGHTLQPPSSGPNVPTSWRRAFSPTASAGATSGSNAAAAAATAAGASASRQQRPASLLYRRPSSATALSHNGNRVSGGGGGGGGGAVGAATVTANANLSNVYTLQLTENDGGVAMAAARPLLRDAMRLRDAYKGVDKGQLEIGGANTHPNGSGGGGASPPNGTTAPAPAPMTGLTALQQVDGVFYWTDERTPIVSWVQFTTDVMTLATCVQNPICLSVASYRLQVLEEKYHLHRLYNADVEENGDRYRRGGGLYANSCRVDNCVGASTAMNAHWLVEYIQQTIDARGGDVLESANVNTMMGGGGVGGGGAGGGSAKVNSSITSAGDAQTLERVCELLDFPDPYQLTVEGLGLQPSITRALPYYDALDPALNGSGRNSAALLRIFLSIRSSAEKGDYLAGGVLPTLTRNELRTSCPQATEMTLDITGVLAQEWEQTAAWVRTHELDSYRTNQFQIVFPVFKWCCGGGSGGGDGQTASTAAAASSAKTAASYRGKGTSAQDGLDNSRGRPSMGANEGRGAYRMSSNGRSGASNMAGHSRSPSEVTDATAPFDAAPEDVLSYENYQQLLDHLFLPLFMATLAPEDPKFVDLASLLQHSGAILLSGDEAAKSRGGLGGSGGGGGVNNNHGGGSGRGRDGGRAAAQHGSPVSTGADFSDQNGRRRRPADVPYTEPVSITYMCYHIWANLCSLNGLRRRRGFNTLQLRVMASSASIPNMASPHDASLLLLSYLIADVVVDAVALDKQPALQYLYGLHGVNVAMCPLARASLGATGISEHPLSRFLWRGLRVSLCTISPLYYHSSPDPLLEEYTTAAKAHRLSPTDISELSLNSVCMSAFDDEIKSSWIGAAFLREGWRGNVPEITNVSTARLQMRHDACAVEHQLLFGSSRSPSPSQGLNSEGAEAQAGPHGGAVARSVTRGSTTRARDIFAAGTTRHSTAGVNPSPLRRAGSALGPGARNSSAAAPVVQQTAPYTVLDPAVDFPRLFLVGPYDRDIANAHIAQSLHRALDLRHQYSSLPLPPPSTLPPSEAAIAAAAGTDGNEEDVRNSWLAALIHDPQAVLPHPTQSMSWAFKKTPVGPAAPTARPSSSAAAPVVIAARPHLHFDEDEWKYKTVEGIIVPHEVHQIPRLPQDMYPYEDFCRHVQEIRHLTDHIRVREFALRRLQLLEHRFNLHAAVNHSLELGSTAARASQNRDFYQSTKVDNNIRMETGMTARQLLAFIVDKATHNGDDIVSHPKGKEPQTLRQLLSELHISPTSLTVDDLNIQAGATSSDGGAPHNPFTQEGSQGELLTLLLKTDNQMNGRYFAELTKRTFEELSRDQHTFTESRLPVYGASAGEWGLLSHWFDTHGMSSSHNQWVVQLPRIYSSLRKAGRVASFAEYLEHIFEPLWRISLHPNSDPRLFHFINHIAAFDCVEDERRPDMPLHRAFRAPHEWTSEEEPPYNYYLYHLYANLRSLNRFRQRRRFSVFAFRPSCGEAGDIDHLIGGFLLAQNINYGVRLADSAPLQYLFYLAQIGVTLSPLSNNTKLDLNYLHNPFPALFRRGLRVSLGTDSPLLYHHTQEPLLEEYSIASKIWKLSPNDLSEVARNSVLLSNFSLSFKEEKLGPLYFLSSSAGNDITRTHLSDVRVAYRFETYHTEVGFLEYISGQHFHKALLTLAVEAQCKQLCGIGEDASGTGEGVEGAEDARRRISGSAQGERKGEGSSAAHAPQQQQLRSSGGNNYRNNVLIDPTPKEADVKQLEQQRGRMQRQLRDLTAAVTDLHKQNRLLTTKLGEEKERDQQAAQLRRHRVGDKLRELQVLLDQKQVYPSPAPPPSARPPSTSADNVAGGGGARRTAPTVEAGASPLPDSLLPPAGETGGAAGMGAAVQGGLNDGSGIFTNTEGGNASDMSSHVGTAAADGVAASPNSAPPAPALSSHDVFSTVRSRKVVQREETIAQTRQLLAHSESLWRSPSAVAHPRGPPGSGQTTGNALPPLEATPAAPHRRWSPSPSTQDL